MRWLGGILRIGSRVRGDTQDLSAGALQAVSTYQERNHGKQEHYVENYAVPHEHRLARSVKPAVSAVEVRVFLKCPARTQEL